MARNIVYHLMLTAVLVMLVGNGNCQSAPGPCGENEQQVPCVSCPPSCDDVANGWYIIACKMPCIRGCACKPGFVLNSEKKCVPSSDCPCKENSYYTKGGCVDNCPLTCENYKKPPEMCTEQCKVGCNCNKGFVRKNEGGDCVRPEVCP